MTDEWFRLPDWDEQARSDFERKLSRSRAYNRAQYLRIKGLALEEAGEIDGARELWERVLHDDGEFAALEGCSASEHLGDSYADEDPDRAVAHYRRSMENNPQLDMTTGTQHIKIAEILTRRGAAEDIAEASELLRRWLQDVELPFPNAHFRWNLVVIDIAEKTGDRETVRDAARRAIELADLDPIFPHHQAVGVVTADSHTLTRLQRLARES